ncbi:hypothetical protein TR13x_03625 [Caloranaerobacter sp. TR13]|uniref:P-II family nitrogen regulator n=1 Tax=Caloranaerobacter sp. TR13 TaxID=1302151 RepID=UPI0006D3C0C1|nr:P-II family nitrogen regulator [Caloranaerobacter sp. TR13]KPU27631.1 hypothetical protein TR13x_03625 [Caloranaerobacter sp. TR13]
MYALFVVINEIYKLDAILERFFEIGVGATVIDSVGMGKVLLQHNVEVPIFSSIRRMIEGNRPYNKTIISVIRDEEKLRKAIQAINEELDYINNPGIGFVFVVPVSECYGFGIEKNKA